MLVGNDGTYSLKEENARIKEQFRLMEKMYLQPLNNSVRVSVEWFRVLSQSVLTNTETHGHSGIEMHFLLQGRHAFYFQDRKITLRSGEGILIPPNQEHRLQNGEGENGYFLRCVLNCSLQTREDDPEGQYIADSLMSGEPWKFTLSDRIVQLLDACMDEAVDMHSGYVSMIENNILGLLFQLARERTGWPDAEYSVRYKKSQARQTAQDIRRYIEENSVCGLRLDDVAGYVHMSTKQMQRIYKQEYNITVYQQIGQCILKKAKEKLRETSLNVNDISQMLGFSTVQSFCRFFRSYEGQSPKEYRLGAFSQR